jgi:hypothetical protein
MIGAMISMVVNPEQASAQSAPTDLPNQSKSDGISFAKSFNERVKEPGLLQGESSVDEAVRIVNKSGVVTDTSGGAKKKGGGVQTLIHGELKNAFTNKTGPLRKTMMVKVPQGTTVADESEEAIAEPTAQMKMGTDDISSQSSAFDDMAEDQVHLLPKSFTDGDQSLILSGEGVLEQKELKILGESGSTKSAKLEESAATSKAARKIINTDDKTTGSSETKIATVNSAEGAISTGQVVATGAVVARNEIDKSTIDGPNEAGRGMEKISAGDVSATVSGVVRKETGRETKVTIADAETAMVPTDQQLALPRSDADPEKFAAANDWESKGQSTPGPVGAKFHILQEGTGVLSGIASGVVGLGNTPGSLTVTKLPNGDTGTHATGLSAGSTEQHGPVGVTASTAEMPRMLTATPMALEVGIQNGTHGWLKVRAEMADGGVVNASVSTTSPAVQEVLHRELPSLATYLQEEKVAVNTVAIHVTAAAGADVRGSSGMNGAGGQTPQRSNEGETQHQPLRKTTPNGTEDVMTHRASHGVDEDGSLSLAAYTSGGSWLSVRA